MLESLSFTYDGISCEDLGLVMINTSNGLFEESFIPSRSINETKVNGRPKPYFKGVDIEPLSFSLGFYIQGWKDRNNLREIARWLFKPYYKPLWFESHPEHIYYAMFIGNSELLHNGCKDGYVTIEVRCDSPYRYSPIHTYNYSILTSLNVSLFNDGDLTIRPKMKITPKVNGNISIKNNANGQEFILNNVKTTEIIEVDCANESITSSLEEIEKRYLFDSHNDIWLDFDGHSEATFTFTGNFDVEFSLEYAYLTGDSHIF